MASRRALLGGILAATALHAADAQAEGSKEIGVFPIAFALAEENGQRVVDDRWLAAQLAEVERLYGPLGIHFP